MRLIAVDDEKLLLDDLVPQLAAHQGVESVEGFLTPTAALEYLADHDADAAFLDIVLPEMNGLALAKRIKELRPHMKIVFLTAHQKYSVDAFKVRASGYLLKPPIDEEIEEELRNIERETVRPAKKRVVIHTFGNFEVFADGVPVHFTRSKSKEILAYLIDRQGAGATKKEIAAVIWEDKEYSRTKQIQLETLIRELIASLKAVDAADAVTRSRNMLAVNKDAFECDYYSFCAWDADAVNAYQGEYMTNYSWAEFTAGYLDRKTFD